MCFPATTMLVIKRGTRRPKDQIVEYVNKPMKQESLKIIVGSRKAMRLKVSQTEKTSMLAFSSAIQETE